ncbi:hypothetical protein [Arthrobacter cryoconiti]|uniref:Uncharacterized protein n=2 Tax=Arthrobacter cryoconiti TaxID=748907 RepID=A0ABV8QWD1_9MICC|nr:hypothetical protein [Arthrobacter cryoconiti]
MMPIDTLTCQITPDSVEPTSLSCSIPPLEYLDLWTMFGAWATVGATFLLAFFAWKAWNSSQATLKTMERQLVDNKTTAQNAIEANSQLATEIRQRALLADYYAAVTNLGMAGVLKRLGPSDQPDDFMIRNLAASSAWVSWAMELHRINPEFRALTSAWDGALRDELAKRHLSELIDGPTKMESKLTTDGQSKKLDELVGWYLFQLQAWQVQPEQRQKIEGILAERRGQYIA